MTDSILIAYEVFHSFTRRYNGRDRYISINLDMNKVYNRIKWAFFKLVMAQMGFNMQWIKLVMNSVCTVSYSYLVNSEPQLKFKHSRGIDKGIPFHLTFL